MKSSLLNKESRCEGEKRNQKKKKKERKTENEERRCKTIKRFPFFSIRGLTTLLSVMWLPGWEGSLGEKYMYLYIPLLFTRNYHNIVNRLCPDTKYEVQMKKYIKGLAVKLLGMMASSLIKYGVL